MKNKQITLFILHILLMFYSVTGIFSKLAAKEEFLSLNFCLFYAGIIFILAIYAIVWQQIIKKMPLTGAYANRAVTVVWGLVWGVLFFSETITIGKVIGAILVILGIVLFSYFDKRNQNE